jgi:hypothetical protein
MKRERKLIRLLAGGTREICDGIYVSVEVVFFCPAKELSAALHL